MNLKHTHRANVYKAGILAASLSKDSEGTVHFAYLPDYTGPDISFSLPQYTEDGKKSEPFTSYHGTVPTFFANLLPEGYRFDALVHQLKTSKNDEFSVLCTVGSDTPGDVQIISADADIVPAPAALEEDPAKVSFHDLMGTIDERSIPGVQDKVSALMKTLPVSWQTGEALLKISPTRYPHLVENEYLHLKAAQKLKLPVAVNQLVHDINGTAGLLISRFDRGSQGAHYAQEDGAQLLNLAPSEKYAVSTEELSDAVLHRVQAPALAARSLFTQFIFAWLTGNGDMHAKNISILQSPLRGWELSPIYDIPSTLIYGDETMALDVNNKGGKNLRKTDWDAYAEHLNLTSKVRDSTYRKALQAATSIVWNDSIFGDSHSFRSSDIRAVERELSSRRWALERHLR